MYQWRPGGLVGTEQPKHKVDTCSHPFRLPNCNWLMGEKREEQAFSSPLNLN